MPAIIHDDAGNASLQHVLDLRLKNELDPFISGFRASRCEDEPSLRVVPVLLTVAPRARLSAFVVIPAEFLRSDVLKVC